MYNDPSTCQHQYSRFVRKGKHGGLTGEWRYCYDCNRRYFDPYIQQDLPESYEQFDPRNPQPAYDARLRPFEKWLKG